MLPNDDTKTKNIIHQQRCKLEPDKQNKPTINPDSSNNLPHNNNNGDINNDQRIPQKRNRTIQQHTKSTGNQNKNNQTRKSQRSKTDRTTIPTNHRRRQKNHPGKPGSTLQHIWPDKQ